ncbi:MAG: hypothetical protein HQ488_03815 [Parcubacteria group bacterium]|nr:hypothetical protein [Parcubacteria group bacterium]
MLTSVAGVKAAFPHLTWRDQPSPEGGNISLAICGGDRKTGDITMLYAMDDGAVSPLHTHHERVGWPYVESTTCLTGRMLGLDPDDPTFVLTAGNTVDLNDDTPHQPYVEAGGFALVIFRQPAGSKVLGH